MLGKWINPCFPLQYFSSAVSCLRSTVPKHSTIKGPKMRTSQAFLLYNHRRALCAQDLICLGHWDAGLLGWNSHHSQNRSRAKTLRPWWMPGCIKHSRSNAKPSRSNFLKLGEMEDCTYFGLKENENRKISFLMKVRTVLVWWEAEQLGAGFPG